MTSPSSQTGGAYRANGLRADRQGADGRRARAVEKEILGVGWHFPVRVDLRQPGGASAVDRARGSIALTSHEEDIEQAIRIILGTKPGERRMRQTFGCEIHDLVFSPMNATVFGSMQRCVEDALAMWEPRIDVGSVDVHTTGEDGWVDIAIAYRVRTTKDERTLVYPFYVIGED